VPRLSFCQVCGHSWISGVKERSPKCPQCQGAAVSNRTPTHDNLRTYAVVAFVALFICVSIIVAGAKAFSKALAAEGSRTGAILALLALVLGGGGGLAVVLIRMSGGSHGSTRQWNKFRRQRKRRMKSLSLPLRALTDSEMEVNNRQALEALGYLNLDELEALYPRNPGLRIRQRGFEPPLGHKTFKHPIQTVRFDSPRWASGRTIRGPGV